MVRKIFPDDIRTFIFEATPVRTIGIDGGIWFGAWDISLALGLKMPDYRTARLDPDQRQIIALPEGRGLSALEFISTSGVYSIIFVNCPEVAKSFTKWMTRVVAASPWRSSPVPHCQMGGVGQSPAFVRCAK